MLGERSDQRGLWEADRLNLDHVRQDTFYGLLMSLGGRLSGTPTAPGSTSPTTTASRPTGHCLLLQTNQKVTDAEAKTQADFDIRWKIALGIEAEDRSFAKSTLQVFRARGRTLQYCSEPYSEKP